MLGAAPALGAAAKVGAEARGPAVYAPPQPGAVEAAVTPGMHWVEGGTTYSAYYANAGGGTGYNASWVGYYVWTDADGYPTGEFPEVGDVYYMKVAGAVIGNPWSGGFVAGFEVALPQNTSLAISTDTPLMCLLHGNDGTTYDVSNEATCTVATGVYLPISFTYYPIVSYGATRSGSRFAAPRASTASRTPAATCRAASTGAPMRA